MDTSQEQTRKRRLRSLQLPWIKKKHSFAWFTLLWDVYLSSNIAEEMADMCMTWSNSGDQIPGSYVPWTCYSFMKKVSSSGLESNRNNWTLFFQSTSYIETDTRLPLSRAGGQEQCWRRSLGLGHLGRSSMLKKLKNAEKVKRGPTNRPTNRPTDRHSGV